MTGWMIGVAVGIGVLVFGLGVVTATMWRIPEDRAQALLGVVFGLIAITIIADVVSLQASHRHAVECNTATLAVLKTRSDARTKVDASTRRAQYALSVVLADHEYHIDNPGDFDVARRAFAEAAEDRANLDTALATPYPNCR